VSIENMTDWIKSLKAKNTEGFDRIPQRVLKDGCDHLLIPFTTLMNKIYNKKEIHDQWRISKIITVHKKGALKLKTIAQYLTFVLLVKFLRSL
jgi:hypothetical protein